MGSLSHLVAGASCNRRTEVFEGGIEQRIDSFVRARASEAKKDAVRAPTNVFVLVDTSNAMYRDFVYAYDSIADFMHSLDPGDPVVVCTFSRNLFRVMEPTTHRSKATAALQRSATGDDTAMYNALLLTIRDAAKLRPEADRSLLERPGHSERSQPGRRGPRAKSKGDTDQRVSTNLDNAISAATWSRMTSKTGGGAYFARTWQDQRTAFHSLAEMVRNTYTLTYYSSSHNPGFRKLEVRVKGGASTPDVAGPAIILRHTRAPAVR